ncbi:hypothetical protein ACIQF6_04465 [Kitasatospora sp. NPDC092948]|uniref:hypothetical protein n=1 Tax=Kitasatospora sp. NPDC092948 TaxID=3364088 RepID=UPI00380D3AD5
MMQGRLRRAAGSPRGDVSTASDDAACGPIRPGTKKILAGLGAGTLVAAGLWAYQVNGAPTAQAEAPAAGQVEPFTPTPGGLTASINSGSVSVGLGSVSAVVTYTCTDSSAPSGLAALRVQFDQNNNDVSGEVAVPCGPGDINKTQTVTATQIGMSGSQEITTFAVLDDGKNAASTSDVTLVDSSFVHLNPTVTYPSSGAITLSGTYNCASSVPTPATQFVSAGQVNSSNQAAAGSAVFTINTCNGTDQNWSSTVNSIGNVGFASGAPVDVTTTLAAAGGGAGHTEPSTTNYSVILG